ncbi:sulfatase [Gluconobacter kondonii]|uniref:sulfatase family protein n=1 Tax=Gluconobacter kondonii TaxID=941463 RepID=UPI001B8B43C5|nr:sulfatase [Gluconobacter kondonii]MBS1078504.1 sulfatase [Gluconobacter kondonii]
MDRPSRAVSRRHLLATTAGAGVAFSAGAAARAGAKTISVASEAPADRKPNIIWIVCHDIHAPLLGCYGNPLAVTPTIDALAREGNRFESAYATAPVCSPSRFSLVTGLYPQSCGPAENMRAVARIAGQFESLPELMRGAGYYCTNNVFTDYNCDLDPATIWDACSVTAHWRNRPAGKPFFSVYNYLITHESHLFETGTTVTDPARVHIPPYLPDTPDIRDSIARNIDMVNRQDRAVAYILGELEQDGLTQDTIVMFFADHGGVQPRTKRYCYEGGLHVPLIVRFPKKFQNFAQRAAGQVSPDLVSLVDMAPTTLSLAGAAIPAHMQGQPFLGQHVLAPREHVFSGRNRMDERLDLMRTVRSGRYRYTRNYMPHRIYGQHNAYEWKGRGYQSWEEEWLAGRLNTVQAAFWQAKPGEELYDLAADPHQISNLIDDPAHQAELQHLRGVLDAQMIAINDNAFLAEGLRHQGYQASRESGAYPLPELMALGAKVTQRSAEHLPAFRASLGNDSEAVRYWAATGILAVQTPLDARATHDVALAFGKEPSAVVRAVLGEILLNGPDAAQAIDWVAGKIAQTGDPEGALAAVLAATYGRNVRSPAVTPAVQAALTTRVSPPDVQGVLGLFAVRAAARYLSEKRAGTYTPRLKQPSDFDAAAMQSPAGKKLVAAMGGRISDPQI